MKRSSRHGWTLVRLVDGVWRRVETGDRDDLQAKRMGVLRELWDLKLDIHYTGHAVALYDANGAPREQTPIRPRLADGTKLAWPATLPEDGAVPERWAPRPMDPEMARLMESLHPKKAPAGPTTGGDR